MMALEATDDLAEVLVRHQALRLHLLEDLAPAGVALLRGDLVGLEWGGPPPRGLRRVLRLEECSGDLRPVRASRMRRCPSSEPTRSRRCRALRLQRAQVGKRGWHSSCGPSCRDYLLTLILHSAYHSGRGKGCGIG